MADLLDLGRLAGVLVILLLIAAALLLFVLAVRSRYKVVGPNEALIISGTRKKQIGHPETAGLGEGALKVVTGGGTFIWPLVQRASRLSLEAMQLPVTVRSVPTSNKVPITVGATANVRIGNTIEEINAAATRFLSWDDKALVQSINEILEGSLRAIIGTMTVERIIEDRTEFTKQVQAVAAEDLRSMGLVIDVMNVKEITDDQEYIQNLGVPRVQEVRREAETARFIADLAIEQENQRTARERAQARQKSDLLNAEILQQTSAADMRAGQAGPLAEAEARRQVVETETHVARLTATKREEELVAEVKKPAEAEAHRIRITAEAERDKAIRMAEAKAEAIKLEGMAAAEAAEAQARAEGTQVREVALARAEGQMKEAEAINALTDSSVKLRMLEVQPEIVRAGAQAFQGVDHVVLTGDQGLKSFIGMLPVLVKEYMSASTGGFRGGEDDGADAARSPVAPSRPAEAAAGPKPGTPADPSAAPSPAPPLPEPATEERDLAAGLRDVLLQADGERLDEKLTNLLPEAVTGKILTRYAKVMEMPLAEGLEQLVQLAATDPTVRGWVKALVPPKR
ncbi:MAG: hypothetical protein KKA32_06845 [Actinobacteria bacterium]|nr:hypothetical protein [Actinomycetota bacterium]